MVCFLLFTPLFNMTYFFAWRCVSHCTFTRLLSSCCWYHLLRATRPESDVVTSQEPSDSQGFHCDRLRLVRVNLTCHHSSCLFNCPAPRACWMITIFAAVFRGIVTIIISHLHFILSDLHIRSVLVCTMHMERAVLTIIWNAIHEENRHDDRWQV